MLDLLVLWHRITLFSQKPIVYIWVAAKKLVNWVLCTHTSPPSGIDTTTQPNHQGSYDLNKKQLTKQGDLAMNYAETLVSEVEQNPERAAGIVLRLSSKICDGTHGDIAKVFETLNAHQDGTKLSELSGVEPAKCASCVDLLRNAMMLPVIINTLKTKGLMLALPTKRRIEQPKKENDLETIMSSEARTQADFIWNSGLAVKEEQIKGLCAFQVATDHQSAYGQLILQLAGAALAEIEARKK